jgi:hypothetical protein
LPSRRRYPLLFRTVGNWIGPVCVHVPRATQLAESAHTPCVRCVRIGFVLAAVFVVVASAGCGGTHPKAYYGAAAVEKAFAAHGIALFVFLPFRPSNPLQMILAPVSDPATPPSVEVDVYRDAHFASVYLDLVTGSHAIEKFRLKGAQILRLVNLVVLYRPGSQFPLTSVRASLHSLE